MSMEQITCRDLFFNATDRRVMLQKLEKYYIIKIRLYKRHMDNLQPDVSPTRKAAIERRFRLSIKPVELLLHELQSDFMSNVKRSSIRKTLDIAARDTGLLQSERKTMDYLRRAKRRRHS